MICRTCGFSRRVYSHLQYERQLTFWNIFRSPNLSFWRYTLICLIARFDHSGLTYMPWWSQKKNIWEGVANLPEVMQEESERCPNVYQIWWRPLDWYDVGDSIWKKLNKLNQQTNLFFLFAIEVPTRFIVPLVNRQNDRITYIQLLILFSSLRNFS